MTTPEGSNSELEALKHRVDVLTNVANQLADRLFALEHRLAGQPQAYPPPPPSPPPPQQPEPVFEVPQPVPLPAAQPEPMQIETQVGLKWFNRLGVITLIIGVAFAFKYLADNDYIGEGGRVILGVVAAALILFFGDRMWHKDQRTYGQGLTGLGIAILYLSFYAAFGLYSLIPQSVALLLLVITTAAAGAFSLRYDSRAIAILGLIGGYATPFMLSSHNPNDAFFAIYMIVLNGAVIWLARQRNWQLLETVAFAGTAFLHALWIADRGNQMGPGLAVGSSMAQFGLFVTSTVGFVAFLAQLLFTAVIAERQWPPFIELLMVIAGLAAFRMRNREYGPIAAFLGWWISYAIGLGLIFRNHHDYEFAALTVAFLIFLAYPVTLKSPGRWALTVMALSGAAYFGACYDLLHSGDNGYLGFLAVGVAAAYLASGWAIWNFSRETRSALLSAGLAMAFLALAVPIQFSGYRVAIAWAIQAAGLAYIGSKLPDRRVLAGAFVLAIMAASDIPFGIENYGFMTMTVVAVSFWAIAYFISITPDTRNLWALPAYVIGHLVFLSAINWQVFSYLDQADSKLLASSLVLALYGIALLAAGVQTRTVVNRIFGLVLFAIVILKLYLSDVWVLGKLFRVVAFLALGGLLMAGSYLYSRYRGRIETLWKKDETIIEP